MARNKPVKEFDEKVIQISRVSKKTKGGNQIGFSVLMVVGNKKGRVGVGLGKAGNVISAIQKGVKKAKKHLIDVPISGTTIPFSITVKKGAGKVLLKPAPHGSGIIAGGPVRSVVEAAGIRDISAKILGSKNQASSVYATFEALKQIQQIVKVRGIKLRSIAQVEEEEKQKREELRRKRQAEQPEVEKEEIKKNVKLAGKKAVKVKKVIKSVKKIKKKIK